MAKAATPASWKQGQSGNPDGAPEKDLTFRELIRQVGEQKSKNDAKKTRKLLAIEKQWDKAEKGELPSFKELVDRSEGKPPVAVGSYDDDGEFVEGITVTLVKSKRDR